MIYFIYTGTIVEKQKLCCAPVSYLTADKAEKEPGKPRDPVLSVYLSQPDPGGYTQLNDDDETGHSGIGIEFSRYSQISQRWERYNLRYGFFTQGGMPAFHTDAITGYRLRFCVGKERKEWPFG